jgi:hypothetical protein
MRLTFCAPRQASSSAIESAFLGGDNDGDNTLSVSEAASALQRLSGKSVDESTISSACSSCGVPTSREMDRECAPPRPVQL